MSDGAQDVLQRMRSAKDKEKDKEPAKDKASPTKAGPVGTRLIIAPHRRRQLAFWMILAFAAFLTILSGDLNIDKPWWLTGLPIMGLGLMICLIPATEEWEYRPWQTSARQYERHQVER